MIHYRESGLLKGGRQLHHQELACADNKIYIFGAHPRGQTLGHYLKYLKPEIQIVAYLYDNDEENPSEIDGVPVWKISEEVKLDTGIPVYLAMRGINQQRVKRILEKMGMKTIIPVDVELDTGLRNAYVKKVFDREQKSFIKIMDIADCEGLCRTRDKIAMEGTVYVASSVYDAPLQSCYTFKNYEKRIQVGSALTDQRLENAVYDCEGDSISEKNKQYCELTGLYWVWKHAAEDYVGLCHYRRHFLLPDNWMACMEQNHIDVILPVPLYVSPNLADNFRGRHAAKEWDYMMQYLKENLPQDYEKASEFFKGNLYSPCNMLIAKRKVLDELCSWMFPILDAVAAACGTEDNTYDNRYPGFLSERLITYFFETQRKRYQVVYADKNFLN